MFPASIAEGADVEVVVVVLEVETFLLESFDVELAGFVAISLEPVICVSVDLGASEVEIPLVWPVWVCNRAVKELVSQSRLPIN